MLSLVVRSLLYVCRAFRSDGRSFRFQGERRLCFTIGFYLTSINGSLKKQNKHAATGAKSQFIDSSAVVSRCSVIQSGFSHERKIHMIGPKYFLEGKLQLRDVWHLFVTSSKLRSLLLRTKFILSTKLCSNFPSAFHDILHFLSEIKNTLLLSSKACMHACMLLVYLVFVHLFIAISSLEYCTLFCLLALFLEVAYNLVVTRWFICLKRPQ